MLLAGNSLSEVFCDAAVPHVTLFFTASSCAFHKRKNNHPLSHCWIINSSKIFLLYPVHIAAMYKCSCIFSVCLFSFFKK